MTAHSSTRSASLLSQWNDRRLGGSGGGGRRARGRLSEGFLRGRMVPDGPSPEDGPGRTRWTSLRCPVTVANVSVLFALACVLFPAVANYTFFVYRLVFGTLYPAYASYKAVRSRDVREYVKWMMYWIVFALFTCGETITDVFLSFWFPFYYEIKIGFVLWLLSPATKGSSILYRKFVHPMLTNREQEIDEYIARAKEQGYHTVLHLGSKGVNYATNVIMQTAIKSFSYCNQMRSHEDLSLQAFNTQSLFPSPDLANDVVMGTHLSPLASDEEDALANASRATPVRKKKKAQ
ncbi:hypothetical protein J437_LFUL013841 [Ladona fulva]|uniref:Receptor expression-enhancing protein n=1 Tax=Ladona fulva TaxID=123851 RepID=A0A8K0KF19_LADFU|nr:hypothetical protein J437_LFUL013841 [Ladona fulva]